MRKLCGASKTPTATPMYWHALPSGLKWFASVVTCPHLLHQKRGLRALSRAASRAPAVAMNCVRLVKETLPSL